MRHKPRAPKPFREVKGTRGGSLRPHKFSLRIELFKDEFEDLKSRARIENISVATRARWDILLSNGIKNGTKKSKICDTTTEQQFIVSD